MRAAALALGFVLFVLRGYVFEDGAPAEYVVMDGLRAYLANSSASLLVDVGRVASVTVVYRGGVLQGAGPRAWFNVSPGAVYSSYM